MSWEAMEVSMGKTRTGKYTESDICAFTQVQYVVCLPILFLLIPPIIVTLCEGNLFRFIENTLNLNTK